MIWINGLKHFALLYFLHTFNSNVQKSIDYLIELNNKCKTVLNSNEYNNFENILSLNSDGIQVDDLKTNPLSKGKYKASKFYYRFEKMSRAIRASFILDNEDVPNVFHNEEYFSDFMGSVIPVIPMWTCLMLYSRLGLCHRPNNSGAEL